MSIYGDKFNITNQHNIDIKAKLDTLLAKNTQIEINNDSVEALLTAGNVNHASIDGKVVVCNTSACIVSSSALPAGAATESSLSGLNGKVVACDTGSVVVSSSALPSGGSTEAMQNSILAALGGSKTSQTPVNNQSISAAGIYESAEIDLGLAKHISYFGVSSDGSASHEVDLLVSNTSGGTYYKTSHSGMFLAGDFHAHHYNVPYQYVKIRVKNNGIATADFTLHLLST
jgi:hypothetical protein